MVLGAEGWRHRHATFLWKVAFVGVRFSFGKKHYIKLESLILAQNERWRQALYMQVERPLRREWQTGA